MESLQLVAAYGRAPELPIGRFTGFSAISSLERLELMESLMGQDEPLRLLQTFAGWVVNFLPVCRLEYSHRGQDQLLVEGAQGEMQLLIPLQDRLNHNMGELCYGLTAPLQQHHHRLLQQLHQILIYPLRLLLRIEEMDLLSRQDHLTGIGNRASFDESLARAIDLSQRQDNGLLLLLLDLDHFKQINDTHGHPVGDRVLVRFASLANQAIRSTDLAFRLGGDEFALLLQPADPFAAHRVASRLQHLLAQDSELSAWQVDFSFGHAAWQAGMDVQSLYQLADQQLYLNKARPR